MAAQAVQRGSVVRARKDKKLTADLAFQVHEIRAEGRDMLRRDPDSPEHLSIDPAYLVDRENFETYEDDPGCEDGNIDDRGYVLPES